MDDKNENLFLIMIIFRAINKFFYIFQLSHSY